MLTDDQVIRRAFDGEIIGNGSRQIDLLCKRIIETDKEVDRLRAELERWYAENELMRQAIHFCSGSCRLPENAQKISDILKSWGFRPNYEDDRPSCEEPQGMLGHETIKISRREWERDHLRLENASILLRECRFLLQSLVTDDAKKLIEKINKL